MLRGFKADNLNLLESCIDLYVMAGILAKTSWFEAKTFFAIGAGFIKETKWNL